ncbi:TPA: IS5 family transposase [Candidatus Dependentiae bacterium]|nr:MAG: Transposase, IS4 family [candidate division TM6 bacterium GW2011_GWF2_36_131]KKQ03857.1 MAG: Transposase, IS4 family [candidate division TM6 bacterium GW2011_GWE2_36_25]KKQ19434.1 MAG: Transposase, IS4 family [candidate division TM6 bacterium GW2011_GWA2_36_9]HBR70625.1 IS5 family transposase [Candidatus Dependentiae bacterium]HCU00660.1 IS5 family transposase [Candidatus Dependentiae bacterium]
MNWSQYNKNLVQRGNIDLWISEDIVEWWYLNKTAGKGRPFTYTDKAIETCLSIAYLFGMPLRMTEGFMNSFFKREKIPLKAPCYTQLSRRASTIKLPEVRIPRGIQIHGAIDSTGLKLFGEGEWKVRMHGISKRREWRKLHLVVDVETKLIPAIKLTSHSIDDATVGVELLKTKLNGCIKKLFGDGAYDKTKMYQASRSSGTELIAPPAKNAKIQKTIINPAKLTRDHAIARIKILGGGEDARKLWKKETGYHKRSIAETSMYRFKQTFSDKLQHRKLENQTTEAIIKTNILNTFARTGFG